MTSPEPKLCLQVCVIAALCLISTHSMAVDFGFEEKLYVTGSSASVRLEPREGARIAGKLPIGTKLTFVGDAKQLASDPRLRPIESEESQAESCPMPEKADHDQWICISVDDFIVDDFAHYWGGWVSAELVGRNAPKLAELIELYEKTPRASTNDRKKWAERAAALDPLNPAAQRNLLDVLRELGDQAAYAAAKRSFESYQAPQSAASNRKLIFSVIGNLLEPIGEISAGKIVFSGFDQKTNYDFRKRGQIFGLYSKGIRKGWAVTESQFDCAIKTCPVQTIVRIVPATDVQGGLAVNFALPLRDQEGMTITRDQANMVTALAQSWIKSNRRGKVRKELLRKIQLEEGQLAAGALQDGKVVLFGSWVIGSMNDQHYGGPDDIYESLLIIAEQQPDGTFRLARGSGSLAENGCAYFDKADLDGDGVDEIVLRCDQLEGSYNYSFVKRVGGVWKNM